MGRSLHTFGRCCLSSINPSQGLLNLFLTCGIPVLAGLHVLYVGNPLYIGIAYLKRNIYSEMEGEREREEEREYIL